MHKCQLTLVPALFALPTVQFNKQTQSLYIRRIADHKTNVHA